MEIIYFECKKNISLKRGRILKKPSNTASAGTDRQSDCVPTDSSGQRQRPGRCAGASRGRSSEAPAMGYIIG
jgi:hypothetical protein